MNIKVLFFLFFFIANCIHSYAQYELKITFSENGQLDPKLEKTLLEKNGIYTDSSALIISALSLKKTLRTNNYLSSDAQLIWNKKSAELHLNTGPKLKWGEINIIKQDSNKILIPQGGINNQKTINGNKAQRVVNSHLAYLENNGYPFAQVELSNISIQKKELSADVIIESGPFCLLDSIIIKGDAKVSSAIIKYGLRFEKSKPYSEEYIQSLNRLVAQIPYLKVSRSPAVAFSKDANVLYLYLEKVKSNFIDGVIGFNSDDKGTLTLNGDIQLELLNNFNIGEEFYFRWRRPDESVQSLELKFSMPYIFKLPIGPNLGLNIFRQDSSFVNTSFSLGLDYKIQSGDAIRFSYNRLNSNNLSDIKGINSFSRDKYSLGVLLNRFDRIVVPTSGFSSLVSGSSNIRSSNSEQINQYELKFQHYQFLKITERNIVKLSAELQALISANYFLNEMYRIGGLKSLRGFNEQEIFTSAYGIFKTEYRYMLGEFDFISAFADGAVVENPLSPNQSTYYLGLGVGLNFQSGAGIFSLAYAIGRTDLNPFDFRTSKIHFGYISRF